MKRVRVTWQTEETREYEAVVEVPGDADLEDYLHGDSPELVAAEEGLAYNLASFYREVQAVAPAED
jgi:hypothetical protein